MLTEAQVSALEKRRSKTVCLSPLETLMLLSPVPRDGTGQVVGSPGTGFKERSAAKNTSSRSYSPRLAPRGDGSGEKAVALTGKGREWVGSKAGNFNAEFMQPTRFDGDAFVPRIGGDLDDILCERFERIVGCDNCVSFAGMKLQIPADRYRYLCQSQGFSAAPHQWASRSPAGARKLAEYDSIGQLLIPEIKTVA